MDEDGRQMSNSINGEYFKFVLYDKEYEYKIISYVVRY